LNLQAKATEATEEPDGRSVSDLVLDGRRWRCGAGPSDHQGPFRRETGLLVPLGAVRRVPPGLFSLRNAGRWAAYLGNVGENDPILDLRRLCRAPDESDAENEHAEGQQHCAKVREVD
jgi:hypothetical protein